MSLRSMILLLTAAASLAFLGVGRASAGPSDSTAPAQTTDSTVVQPSSDSGESAQADSVKDAGKAADEAAEQAAKAAKEAKDAREHAAKKAKKKAKAAAGGKGTGKMPGTMPVKPDVLPQHVQVQHILIGFTGSVPGKNISRTKEEAKTLAYQILERARKGEDFDELVRKYTDDSPPGVYGMSGAGVAPATGEFPRGGMVPAFGNVGFSISPGNIGIADYDATASPFGWHVIKRLK
jgi:parvulin-like peptidyl-prolyl cis-trans isomerase-like protein